MIEFRISQQLAKSRLIALEFEKKTFSEIFIKNFTICDIKATQLHVMEMINSKEYAESIVFFYIQTFKA